MKFEVCEIDVYIHFCICDVMGAHKNVAWKRFGQQFGDMARVECVIAWCNVPDDHLIFSIHFGIRENAFLDLEKRFGSRCALLPGRPSGGQLDEDGRGTDISY